MDDIYSLDEDKTIAALLSIIILGGTHVRLDTLTVTSWLSLTYHYKDVVAILTRFDGEDEILLGTPVHISKYVVTLSFILGCEIRALKIIPNPCTITRVYAANDTKIKKFFRIETPDNILYYRHIPVKELFL